MMTHKILRLAIFVLEVCVALTAIAGGVALVAGVIRFPLALLQGTPFSDYIIPGLLLAIVVGGSMLVAAATVFIHRAWTMLISAVAGLCMAGFEVVEVALLGLFAPLWQIPYFVVGLVIFGLAATLWLTEYRGQHFQFRHVSHA